MQTVVIGGNGGIGNAFVKLLMDKGTKDVIATYHNTKPAQELTQNTNVEWFQLDATDESAVSDFCEKLGDVGLFINAVGMLHDDQHKPEKSTRNLGKDYFIKSMTINTLPTMLFAKYLPLHFRHKQTAVFATISARVGSIEENYLGGWYSYRASKAALNQVLKTLSIEWRRNLPNVCVVALHPGTTDTALSKPFQKNVPAEQLFTADKSVMLMSDVISHLTPEKSGKFFSFDGENLPW
jgi:NAD(P)-dependent dehydrogenase (short-subunit alcohol dehydrogenase family)